MNPSQTSDPVTLNTRSARRQAARENMLSDSKFIRSLDKAAMDVTKENAYHSKTLVVLYKLTGLLVNFTNTMDPEAHTLLKMQRILVKQKKAAHRGRTITRTKEEEQIITDGLNILKTLEQTQLLNSFIPHSKF